MTGRKRINSGFIPYHDDDHADHQDHAKDHDNADDQGVGHHVRDCLEPVVDNHRHPSLGNSYHHHHEFIIILLYLQAC